MRRKFIPSALFLMYCLSSSNLLFAHTDRIEQFEYYADLNENETRLIEFKDSPEALQLKIDQLNLINSSRKKFGRAPVELDIFASRVANQISKQSAEDGFTGHWNREGEKPYHRYAAAGGVDHIAENASASWTKGKLDTSSASVAEFMQEAHRRFMAERPPEDGHKQNTLDRAHNYLGLGFYISEKQFRYYEEYVDRYFEFSEIPKRVKPNEPVHFEVSCQEGQFLYFGLVFYEPFPKSMNNRQIARRMTYKDFSREEVQEMLPWQLAKLRQGRTYPLHFNFDRPGLYYIHLYQHDRELREPASYTTEGKIQGSGVVIRVEP